MATGKQRKGGAKPSRSESVSVRFDPRTRYLAEIAARAQRRTLSSFVEGVVEASLRDVTIAEKNGKTISVAEVGEQLWDVHEADRFAILASLFPNLLTYDEQRLWKLINEVWSVLQPTKEALGRRKGFDLQEFEFLRSNWVLFRTFVESEYSASEVAALIQREAENRKTGKAGIVRKSK